MKIEVTQDNIDKGVRGYASLCPIALAIARDYPDILPLVFSKYAVLKDIGGDNLFYDLPWTALDFIYHFDHKFEVKPFSFELTGGYYE